MVTFFLKIKMPNKNFVPNMFWTCCVPALYGTHKQTGLLLINMKSYWEQVLSVVKLLQDGELSLWLSVLNLNYLFLLFSLLEQFITAVSGRNKIDATLFMNIIDLLMQKL